MGDTPEDESDGIRRPREANGIDISRTRRESQQVVLRSASELMEIIHTFLDESARNVPEASTLPQLTIFTGALDRILRYLNESPIGDKLSRQVESFLWNAIEDLSEIEVGLVIAYFSIVIGFRFVLDATPNQYASEVSGIEERIGLIKEEIKKISDMTEQCLRILQTIINIEVGTEVAGDGNGDRVVLVDESHVNLLERQFNEQIRQAKLRLVNCDDLAKENETCIAEVLEDVKGHLLVAGGARATLIIAGAAGIWYLHQSNIRQKKMLAMAAALGVGVVWLLCSVPRYNSLQDEFKNYRRKTLNLRSRLRVLQRNVEEHESAFKDQVKKTRARTDSGNHLNSNSGTNNNNSSV